MLKRIALAAALVAGTYAAPAYAMDCGAKLSEAQTALGKASKLSPEQRAARTRVALMGYDMCMIGDTKMAFDYFKMAMENAS
jgi:hypothetical protein